MRFFLSSVLLSFSILLVAVPAPARKKKDDQDAAQEQLDRIALASMLLKDGHYDRAASVLSEVDTQSEGVDLAHYHTLMGLIRLKGSDYVEAAKSLESAIKAGQKDPMVYVFLAQAKFGQEDFRGTIRALKKAGDAADGLPGVFLIRAQSHWRLDQKDQAYDVLEDGIKKHPDNIELTRHKILLLVDMSLFQAAVKEGQKYLETASAGAEDHVAIAEALIRARQHDKAVLILEEAKLRYPGDEQVLVQLARAYLESGSVLTAAGLFREATYLNPEFALDAAELYRRGGRLMQALHLNARVVRQKEKVRQRMGILIELERFEEAAALEPRLERLGLLDEDAVTYALSYALFKTGEFKRAEGMLKRIKDPELFRRSADLRRAMETCAAAGWQCSQ